MNKKYLVIPYNYEYNDEYYYQKGHDIPNQKLLTKEEAIKEAYIILFNNIKQYNDSDNYPPFDKWNSSDPFITEKDWNNFYLKVNQSLSLEEQEKLVKNFGLEDHLPVIIQIEE